MVDRSDRDSIRIIDINIIHESLKGVKASMGKKEGLSLEKLEQCILQLAEVTEELSALLESPSTRLEEGIPADKLKELQGQVFLASRDCSVVGCKLYTFISIAENNEKIAKLSKDI